MSSRLGRRLKQLQRESGASSPQPVNATLAERLARMRAGERRVPRGASIDAGLAQRLGGKWLTEGLIGIEWRYRFGHRHGNRRLDRLASAGAPAFGPAGVPPREWVFMDTETTGLAGGTGTVAFLIGTAIVERDALVLRQYLITEFAAEAAMLRAVGEELTRADALATFNGKAFDVPLLMTRHRLSGIAARWADLAHADLIHPLRRLYARRWPDCRLVTAEQRLLGFERRDDLPAEQAPQAWFALLRRGEADQLEGVLRHNRDDLLSLAALAPALDDCLAEPYANGSDPTAAARLHMASGHPRWARALLERNYGRLDRAGRSLLAELYRRAGQWPQATAVWQELAESDCPHSLLRLAKYYEHRARQAGTALAHARRLARLEPGEPAHRQRIARLERRLSKGAAQWKLPHPSHGSNA